MLKGLKFTSIRFKCRQNTNSTTEYTNTWSNWKVDNHSEYCKTAWTADIYSSNILHIFPLFSNTFQSVTHFLNGFATDIIAFVVKLLRCLSFFPSRLNIAVIYESPKICKNHCMNHRGMSNGGAKNKYDRSFECQNQMQFLLSRIIFAFFLTQTLWNLINRLKHERVFFLTFLVCLHQKSISLNGFNV